MEEVRCKLIDAMDCVSMCQTPRSFFSGLSHLRPSGKVISVKSGRGEPLFLEEEGAKGWEIWQVSHGQSASVRINLSRFITVAVMWNVVTVGVDIVLRSQELDKID